MSTISGISSAGSAWSDMSSARASSRADRMFAKVDADGSGGIDKTELQGMLDKFSAKTGNSLGSAGDLMSKMDSNGDGSLSKDELDTGMKSLMPTPSSTVDFAQRGGGGMPPPPPADSASGGSDSSGTSSSGSTDPLDVNKDGVVSAQERAAGDVKAAMKALFAAVDTNGDKSVSKSEADNFKEKVDSVIQGLQSGSASSASQSDSASASSSDSSSLSMSSFIDMVMKQYGKTAAANATADTSLSVAA